MANHPLTFPTGRQPTMQTIGVLGGIGPQATMDFEARLHTIAQQFIPPRGNSGYPPLVVAYHRRPPIILGDDGQPVWPLQPDPELLALAHRLGAWADFLVITSNGAHGIRREIEQVAGRSVLSMIDSVLAVVCERGWRRVGLLGLGEPRIYQVPVRQMGLVDESLPVEMRDRLDQAIFRLMEGRAGDSDRAVAEAAVATLHARRVDGIILGCTEIPLLLGAAADAPGLLNPIQVLAEAAVRQALKPGGLA